MERKKLQLVLGTSSVQYLGTTSLVKVTCKDTSDLEQIVQDRIPPEVSLIG